jgi:mannose-6-phosphate isomerase-like protein (cupin superfamily)
MLERNPDMKPVYVSKNDIRFTSGRRPEIRYRDLLVKEATGDRMRAEIMHVAGASSNPTGWHYHTCEIQFLFMMKGWVDMDIDGLGPIHLAEGESVMIPGGTIHQEMRSSENMELLEVSVPAALGTVNCKAPVSRT